MAKTTRRLTRTELRELGRIIEADRVSAEEWWLDYAPPEYAYLFDALQLSSLEEIPQNDEELIYLLREMYPGPAEGRRRRWFRKLWGLGLLFFFIRGYYYNRLRGRVAPLTVRAVYDRAVDTARNPLLADCQDLRSGKISILEWQDRMVGWIKMSHIAGAILAAGGLARISAAEWDIVNKNIEYQLTKLHGLSAEIAGGLRDGTICRRMFMYLQSGRSTYHEIEALRQGDAGYTEYRNIITARESCGGCIEETAKGWVPLGELVPIGDRDCLTNCKCYYEYRNPDTGDTDART